LTRIPDSWLGRSRPVILALTLLCVSGCGLSNYEKQMAEEQDRLQKEEANKYLGEPVQLPQRGEGDTAPVGPPIYLKPPKGVSPIFERRALGPNLLAYPGLGDFQGVYLAVATGRKRDDFRRSVVEPFGIPPRAGYQEIVVQPVGREAMRMDAMYHEASTMGGRIGYFVYFYEEGSHQVAIIYQVEAANSEKKEVVNAIDHSLRTLAVGARKNRQG
jgi:hypothetical protein